jgi:hypothetical protein
MQSVEDRVEHLGHDEVLVSLGTKRENPPDTPLEKLCLDINSLGLRYWTRLLGIPQAQGHDV